MKNKTCKLCISKKRYDAVIFDMDGVVTQTARIHAEAWKELFNEYLKQYSLRTEKEIEPFNIEKDYPQYIDGKPRYDGVKSFLASRGIELPFGAPDDPPHKQSICGLGNKKNNFFLNRLKKQGVKVYNDAIKFINSLKSKNINTAIITSSKNCSAVLNTANITSLFDTKVDGVDAQKLKLQGKPAPDVFLEAAKQIGISPERAVVMEDAIAGVEAGRRGNFGLVVGVNRRGNEQKKALEENGADVVVSSLSEIKVTDINGDSSFEKVQAKNLPSALECIEQIKRRIKEKSIAIFLDYDGTLTPIVETPDKAILSASMRDTVRSLAKLCTVGIISGRDLADVKKMVGIDEIFYGGSHGFDIAGPQGKHMQLQQGLDFLPALDEAEEKLKKSLHKISGAFVERKKFSVAVHYRKVREENIKEVRVRVDNVAKQSPNLRKSQGKKIYELQPSIEWDKGKALVWFLESLKLNTSQVLPIYIGDDTTDEDAFKVLVENGIGILVAENSPPTSAQYILKDPGEVEKFLNRLVLVLRGEKK